MGSFDVLLDDERTQLDEFIEEYRSAIEMTLDGLTDGLSSEAKRKFWTENARKFYRLAG